MTPRRGPARWYAALLRVLPPDFRARHGEEMTRIFDEMWRARRGTVAGARLWVVAVWDVLRWAWREWVVRGGARRAVATARHDVNDGGGGGFMDDLIQDLRYAVRQLLHRPGFAAVLVLTLALGIGANTAVFSVVDGVLLRPLPYPEPERLMVVWTQNLSSDLMAFPHTWSEYERYRDQSRSFEELGLWGTEYWKGTDEILTGGDSPERLEVAYVSWTLFGVLGVEPVLGRVFGEEEDVAGRDDVVVLSHGLWERRFGSDPSIVGRTVELSGDPTLVLGVMPAAFGFPSRDVDAWLPTGIDPVDPPGRGSHLFNILGRLEPGATLEQASVELGALMDRWDADEGLGHNWSRSDHPAFLRPLHEEMVGDVRRSLVVALGAVGIVLLIACVNVANLLLVRGEGRLREVSIRAALGAGRGRIVRQLLTESLLIALVGGATGLLVAHVGLAALLSMAPSDLPRTEGIGLNGTVLAFSGGVALLAGLLFGLAPALQARRMDVQGALRAEGRGGTATRGRFRWRQLLVVSQTALAVVLLIAAGLLVQSFWRLSGVDPGFRLGGVLQASMTLPATWYPQRSDVTGFYRELIDRLEEIPGVEAAAMVDAAPLTESLPVTGIRFENRPASETDPPLSADYQVVSAGYFATMGIPVLHGRVYHRTDDPTIGDSEAVVVIDEELAGRFFADPRNAIGKRMSWAGQEYARIVGIVGAVRQSGLDREPRPHVYLLHSRRVAREMTLLLRTSVEPLGLVDAVRREVRVLDPNLPLHDVTTAERTVAESTASERFNMFLQLVFAGVALALAVVGIYGVLSYSVAQRTREIGIRMALGAERGSILGLVVGQGMLLVGVALVLGVLGALAAGRVLSSLLFGVSPHDPLTYVAVTGAFILVGLAACWIPARRATAVSPQTALRLE